MITVIPEITDVLVEPKIVTVIVSGVGQQGPSGQAATVAVGTVTTTASTVPASVTNVGTSLNAVFNFSIPKGADGDTMVAVLFRTDYDYDITGSRNGNNKVFVLSENYVTNSTRVYVNGLRQTRGEDYDYEETGQKTITFSYNIDQGDLLVVDYIKQ